MPDETRPINPFSTSRIRPGAIPFRFGDGEDDVDRLIERFMADNRLGQIVGPHGSGKSTLLALLREHFERQGQEIVHVELHDGSRQLAIGREVWRAIKRNAGRTFLMIDGFEQLGRLTRWSVVYAARRRKFGLLITSHDKSSAAIPVLYQTKIDRLVAKRLIEELTVDYPFAVEPSDLDDLIVRHQEDFRAVLFELYDWYEEVSRTASG